LLNRYARHAEGFAVRIVWAVSIAVVLAGSAAAGDEPFAAHVGPPRYREHSHERAGTTGTARFAAPSVSCKDAGGYVGGNRLRGTPATALSPNPGVFAWDYVGHGKYPNRIFLGFGPDKPRQQPFQPKYDTDPKK
jgi:hypothetical protein